jgi:putative membrane protein
MRFSARPKRRGPERRRALEVIAERHDALIGRLIMRLGTLALLSAASLALAACGHKDNDTTTPAADVNETDMGNTGADRGNTAATMSPGQTFANAAAASDAFEIATSKLAQGSAHSAAVKSFADKMIAAHTASTGKLKAAAAGASPAITPDATLTAEQQQTLDSLKGKTGADFDKAYAAAQVDAHQKTLDALKAYSASGDVPQLKTFAGGMIATVTAHLNMAKGLK